MDLSCISFEYASVTALTVLTIIIAIYYNSYANNDKCSVKQNRIEEYLHNGVITKVVADNTSCIRVLNELIAFKPRVLGLDCEWVKDGKICLLQLAHSQLIVLIRLHELQSIPLPLIGLLSNNQILKCGVGIYHDAAKLRHDYSECVHDVLGCVDLNHLLPLIGNHSDHDIDVAVSRAQTNTLGLNTLSKLLLSQQMKYKDKKQGIARSNWQNACLSAPQIHYAADDALVGYRLFQRVMQFADTHDPAEYLSVCVGRIDIDHFEYNARQRRKKKQTHSTKRITLNNDENNKTSLRSDSIQKNQNEKHKKREREPGKKRSFFDNCQILKPNGEILSCCSRKSMRWYIRKDLADIVDEKTVRLKFEPKMRGLSFDRYHQTEKTSQCFNCGTTRRLAKFAVVPECYRKYMHEKYNDKAQRIHDCIPLCTECSKQASKYQNRVRDELCDKYSVADYKLRSSHNPALSKAKKAAWALTLDMENKCNIPVQRKRVLLTEICAFFQFDYQMMDPLQEHGNENENGNIENEVTYNELLQILSTNGKEYSDCLTTEEIVKRCMTELNETEYENEDKIQWELHSQELVQVFEENETEIIQLWRRAFVEHMKPRFLPDVWSVAV